MLLVVLRQAMKRGTQRMLEPAARARCHKCSTAYGIEAARAAQDAYMNEGAAALKSGELLDVARPWILTCPKCGETAAYDPSSGTVKPF